MSRLAPLEPHALAYDKPLCASLDGFTLHAATRAGPLHPAGREALLRCVLRPPIAQERVELRPDGLVRIKLKKAYTDGTIAVDTQQNTDLPISIWVMGIDGSHKSRLTGPGHYDIYPIYSPDGNKIVFTGDSLTDGPINIFTMNADGSGIQQIATGLIFGGCPAGNCLTPDWGAKP